MKKKLLLGLLTFLMLSVLMACLFTGCATRVKNISLNFVVDEEIISTIETSGSEVISMPDNPKKEGYTFDGWYWDKDVWSNAFTANSLLNAPISSDMSVYAKLTPIQYSITYNLDGGTNSNPTSYTIETSTITLSNAEKEGYTFNGWYKEASFSSEVKSIANGSTGNIELYAKYTINQYTISFNTDGGSDVDSLTKDYNSDVIAPSNPVKIGYDFGGWYLNGVGTAYQFTTMPAKDISLNAKWIPTEYSLTYNLNGGTNGENPTKYTIETNTITLANASRSGYIFDGWYKDGNKVENIEIGSTGNIALTAQWTPIEYTITYENTKAVANNNPVKFTIESNTITLSNLEKLGYTFNGWYNGLNKITEIENGTIGNITLTANWTVNGYEIKYHNVDNATINNPDVYDVEDEPLTLADASKNGYTFIGWYSDANFNDKFEVIYLGTMGDLDLYAKWEIIEYAITYIYDDTQGDLSNSDSLKAAYTVEDEFDFAILVCSMTGYEFSGWYTEKNLGTGTRCSGISKGTTGDKTYYAQWSPAIYKITYHNVENVTNTNPTTYTIETNDFNISNVSRVGYTFDGWYCDSALENVANTNIVKGSHGDVEYYAKWTAIPYNITYNLYGGTYAANANPTSYTIEDNISLINPQQDGKYFIGWYTLAENGDLMTVISNMTGNITLNARWLTFDSKGGSVVDYDLIFSEAGVTAPNDPTKDYYNFEGWFFDEQFSTVYSFNSLPTASSTLHAKWVAINYTITYVLNDGTNNRANPSTYTVEDAITFEQPSKIGSTFNGWYSNESFTSTLVTGIDAGSHGNIIIYANFGINQYTISFESNGGTSVNDITQNYATSVSAPVSPAKTGYTFGGWYSDNALKNAYTFTTIPAYDFTLYAKWNLVDYQITYNLDGGTNSVSNPEKYTIENATIVLANPTKTGYTFGGWFIDNVYIDSKTEIANGSYGDIELFAKWDIIIYSITYVVPTNTINDNISEYTVATNSTQLNNAVLSGYTFNGWYANSQYSQSVSSVGGGSIGNITLYGKFTANKYNIWLDGSEQASCTVSFNLNGASGVAPATQNITDQNTLMYPEIPTRNGYIFGGWYTKSDCEGTPFDFSALIGSNITLYAKWVAIGNSAVININSTAIAQLSGTTEKVFKFIPLASGNVSITSIGGVDTLGSLYKGETLLKMDDDSGSDSNFLIVYNVTAGEIYEIRVRGFSASTSDTTTISLTGVATVAEGGFAKAGNKSEATFDSSFKLPIPEAVGNYKFLGWKDANGVLYTDAQGNSLINWNKAEDSVLYSKWEKMEYTVTFVSNGGSAVDGVTLEYGARLDLNAYVTTRSNYTFSGWYLSSSDSEAYSAGTMPDHDITLYAKWTTFALGTIKYDEDKKAISVNDEVSPKLFNAICLDTNGNLAEFTATISGSQIAGNTVTIRLVANSGNKTKQTTIAGVQVYGMPTLTITKSDVEYVNLIGGLTAEWFGASGTDTFGEATEIQVKVAEGFYGGDIGSVIIESIDASGNITSQTIDNLRLYDLPQITYDVDKTAISVEDNIVATLFNAIAQDSFGERINVEVTYETEYVYTTSTSYSYNYFTAGRTGTYYLYYKNGTSGARTYLSVYCITTGTSVASENYYTNTSYSYRYFSVVEGYEYRINTRAYSSSYANEFYMYLATGTSSTSNRISLFEGKDMAIVLTAIDSKGNITVIDLNVDVYGAPKFIGEPATTEFKESDEITVEALGLIAEDTYGNNLDISLSLKSGIQVGGEIMVYTATIVDVANNILQKDISIKIYGTPSLKYSRDGLSVGLDVTIAPSVTIIYNHNYDGAPSNIKQTISSNEVVKYPEIPIRSGYVFRGWFTDKKCVNIYNFSSLLNENIMLYAGWIETATTYKYLRTIDIVNGCNSSFNVCSLGIGDNLTENCYTYFRIYVTGQYVIHYKKDYSTSAVSGGSQYFDIINSVTNQILKSSIYCSSTSFSSFSFEANAGDVICLRSYGTPATNSSGSLKHYNSPQVYITGGVAPSDGGKLNSDCTNHLKGMEEVFNAVALDSFGEKLDISISYKSGVVQAGNYMVYILTAIDHLGNSVTIETKPIGVYDVNDIIFEYSNMASDLIKISSKGEEFFATATDTFGQDCNITIEPEIGFELKGGEVIDLYLVATDIAGNSVRSEKITGIKVYDIPTVFLVDELKGYTIEENDDISFLFKVIDSFGEEIYADVTTEDAILPGNFITVSVISYDDADNMIYESFEIFVMPLESGTYVELYVDNDCIEQLIVSDAENFSLNIPESTNADFEFYAWVDSKSITEDTTVITYSDGISISGLREKDYNSLYAVFVPKGYSVIHTFEELSKLSNLSGKYYLLNNIDCKNQLLGLGNFSGVFEGNGHSISNIVLKTGQYMGLFSENSGTIKDLSISITLSARMGVSRCYAGGLVGSNSGNIDNCSVHGSITVSTSTSVGATQSYFPGYSYNSMYAGGLAGSNTEEGQIKNSFTNVVISGTCGATFSNSHSSSAVSTNCNAFCSASSYIGGLVGYNSGTIINCFTLGDVSSFSDASSSSYSYSNSTSGATVYGYAGGVVGYNIGSIAACFAVGNILVKGTASARATQYNDSSKTSTSVNYVLKCGGIVGFNHSNGSVTNCYRNSAQTFSISGDGTSKSPSNTIGAAVTEDKLKSVDFYRNSLKWSSSEWILEEGDYPSLRRGIN